MTLIVVKYGNPVLRRRGSRVESISDEIQKRIADMFDTMRASRGIGLAAQQVGYAIQIAVVDVRGVKDRPSQLWIDGQSADVESFMPLVLINPKLTPVGSLIEGPEGCLSFPDIFGQILRPAEVDVTAQNERGEMFSFRAGGLLARVVQHEVDHLNGILFIDRMDSETRTNLKDDIDKLMSETKAKLTAENRD